VYTIHIVEIKIKVFTEKCNVDNVLHIMLILRSVL
jgi:hypothetical protein